MPDKLKEQLTVSRRIYHDRIDGADLWSAATRCLVCGDWWLWGVKDNLDFTCPKCTTV